MDDHGSLLNNERRSGTKSTATVTFTGTATTVVPEETRMRNSNNQIFLTIESATVPTGGSVDVNCEAENTGPISAPAGTLTSLIDVIIGISSIDNTQDAIVGGDEELDSVYKQRLESQSMINAASFTESVEDRVSLVSGITRLKVIGNDSDEFVVIRGGPETANSADAMAAGVDSGDDGIKPGKLWVIAKGGTDEDISIAIRNSKTGGIPTVGSVNHSLTIGSSPATEYNFSRITEVALKITMQIEIKRSFPSNGITQIKNSVINWVNRLDIGGSINEGRVYEALNIIPGYVIATDTGELQLTILEEDDASDTTPDFTDENILRSAPNADELYTLDNNNIIITTTNA